MSGPVQRLLPSRAHAFAFLLLYLAYVVAYFCRRNYGFWLNGLLQRGAMDATTAAVFGSTMELAYGGGKLFAGPIVDNAQPKTLLLLTLAIAGACNAFMFQTEVYWVDVGLWAVNGFAQAFIWPALALIFFNWFGKSPATGTLYSLLSTNQNVGSAITPVLLAPLVRWYGWRAALWGPALVSAVFCATSFVLLQASPNPTAAPATQAKPVAAQTAAKKEEKNDYAQVVRFMLTTPDIWLLGLGYAFLTMVRVGMGDWGLVILRKYHHATDAEASFYLALSEMGGVLGGIGAGMASDVLFRGNRVPVMVVFSSLLGAPAVWGVFFAPHALLPLSYFMFGFASFGPHVLVGLLARELFPKASSTAGAFSKSLAQLGGALSGVPISMVAERFGWSVVGWVWVAALALTGLSFFPLMMREGKKASGDAETKKTQ